METSTWLLLLYALPMNRTSARVKLWRKLKRFGAVQLKTSAYVLPDNPTQYERFQWLATEVTHAGGEATLIRVAKIEGMANSHIVQMFNDARAGEYEELAEACRALLSGAKSGRAGGMMPQFAKQQQRLMEIKEVDYFKSPAAHDAQMILYRLENSMTSKVPAASQPTLKAKDFQRRIWLTRPRPGIDRAGSAWLIQNLIDPKARFVFGMETSEYPKALPFDMADAEFSHHGDNCTFETLVKRFGIADKVVGKISEMVHDADLEDGKFQTRECIGINTVLRGWARTKISDAELLARGIECFEGLYQQLKNR